MTAENPEAVLEGDDDDDGRSEAGAGTLVVAGCLTIVMVAWGVVGTIPVELTALTFVLWVLGSAVHIVEVTHG